MVSLEQVDGLKVAELKAACKELGLEQTGVKAELVARLKAALSTQAVAGTTEGLEEEGAGDVAGAATEPATEPAAKDAADDGSGKHSRITFSETEAAKFEGKKIEVIPVAKSEEPKGISEAEKLKARAERFKDPDTDRLKQRAQRFGLIDADAEKDKMLKRAERFGVENPQLNEIKKKQRAERFGIVDPETKKKMRLDKFKPLPTAAKPAAGAANVLNAADFEEKRKARAARFAPAT